LDAYQPETVRGGHAVCLVGYTKNYFIVRNSWSSQWGDNGFAYASNQYAAEAFTEAYGAVL
jgi:C1A family cysteine protease